MKKYFLNNNGTVLVTLLVFVVMAVVIISAAVMVTIINTQTIATFTTGNVSYSLAEAGIESAVIRLVRDPNNYAGESLDIDGDSVNITVTGSNLKTIISEARVGDYIRKIRVTALCENNKVVVQSWNEY